MYGPGGKNTFRQAPNVSGILPFTPTFQLEAFPLFNMICIIPSEIVASLKLVYSPILLYRSKVQPWCFPRAYKN